MIEIMETLFQKTHGSDYDYQRTMKAKWHEIMTDGNTL